MRKTIDTIIEGATVDELFDQVATLDRYPAWMRMVHRVDPDVSDDGRLAWQVELRARVGPFARSKRLRMVRTVYEPGDRVRFERVQDDDRDHAEWILAASVIDGPAGARLIMDLEYTGDLWGDAVLSRLLDEEVRRGKDALHGLVSASPKR